jgi:hypothetical protein
MNIPIGTYRFAYPDGETGWFIAFNEDECECCGCTVQSANSLKTDAAAVKKLGLKVVFELPEEAGYSEAFGGVTCLGCNDHIESCQ